MRFMFRMNSHYMLVELQPGNDWEEARAALGHILHVSKDRVLITPGGKPLGPESPALHQIDKSVDLLVNIADNTYSSRSYHSTMRYARLHTRKHPIPEDLLPANKKRRKTSQGPSASTKPAESQGPSASTKPAESHEPSQIAAAKPAESQEPSQIAAAKPAESQEPSQIAAAKPAESPSQIAAADPAVVAEPQLATEPAMTGPADPAVAAEPQLAIETKLVGSEEDRLAFGRGETTLYIPPWSPMKKDTSDESSSADGSSGSGSDQDSSDKSEQTVVGKGQSDASEDADDLPSAALEAPASAASPAVSDVPAAPWAMQPVTRTVIWPPGITDFKSASDTRKITMYEDLHKAFISMSKQAFEAAAERDIASAQLLAATTTLAER